MPPKPPGDEAGKPRPRQPCDYIAVRREWFATPEDLRVAASVALTDRALEDRISPRFRRAFEGGFESGLAWACKALGVELRRIAKPPRMGEVEDPDEDRVASTRVDLLDD